MSQEASEEGKVEGPLPVVDWLKGASTDDPYLEGHKCGACGAVGGVCLAVGLVVRSDGALAGSRPASASEVSPMDGGHGGPAP